jgi:putative acetyltransferase
MMEKPQIFLRPPSMADAEALCEMSNLPLYRQGTPRLPFHSLADTCAYLERVLGENGRQIGAYHQGRMIGMAGLWRGQGLQVHSADFSIGIHDAYHRQGIGLLLMDAVIDISDNWWHMPRLTLTVYADNLGAIALYRRFGFVDEGIAKGHSFRNGAFADILMMGRWRPSDRDIMQDQT